MTELKTAPEQVDDEPPIDEGFARGIGEHVLFPPDFAHYGPLSEQTKQLGEHTAGLLSRSATDLLDRYQSGLYPPGEIQKISEFIAAADVIEDKDERVREAARIATMLGAEDTGFDDEEMSLQLRESFGDLVSRGGDPMVLRQLLRSKQGLEHYTSLAASETQKNLIARLASVKGLSLDSYVASGMSNAAAMILEHPELFEQAIPKMQERLGAAMESGYPAENITKTIEDFFGPYTMNGMQQGEHAPSMAEQYAAIIDTELRAIKIIGGSAEELRKLMGAGRDSYDHVMLGVADRLHRGEEVDAASTRADLEATTKNLKDLQAEHPDILEALRLTAAGFSGDIQEIEKYASFAKRIAPDFDFLRETMGVERKDVFNGIGSSTTWVDSATGEFREELFTAIEQAKRQVGQHPGLAPNRVLSSFLSYPHNAESLRIFGNFLDSEELAEHVKDPRTAASINRALFTIAMHGGAFDFAKAMTILNKIDEDDPEILSEIIRADVNSAKHGVIFHDIAPDVLSRRDRDGNLYDGPRTLSRVIDRYANDKDDNQDIRWFAGSELPIAAMDTVMQFREKAKDNGIADDPKLIYEWAFKNAEHVSEMSRENLSAYVLRMGVLTLDSGEQVKVDEEIAQDLIKAAREALPDFDQGFRLLINMSPETIQQIDNGDGVIRSSFESDGNKKQYGRHYTESRSGVEVALGIRLLDATNSEQPHPVYGSAVFVGSGTPEGAVGYGEVALSFKPDKSIIDATSFTPEDSFHGANRLTAEDAKIARLLKTAFGRGSMLTADYVEAQISTTVTLDMVDRVYVASEEMRNALPAALREKAVVRPVAAVGMPSQYNGRREETFVRQHLEKTGLIEPQQAMSGL